MEPANKDESSADDGQRDPDAPVHEPLSDALSALMEQSNPDAPLTLNLILERTAGRGIHLVIIVLTLPFLLPTPFFGLSSILGTVIGILAVRIGLGLPPRLPKRFADRPLPARFQELVVVKSIKLLRRLERWVKPRKDKWLDRPPVRLLNGGLVTALALLLALPLPPVIPFTNTVPAYGIILISLSVMEEDGVLIWFGYLAVLGNVVFFTVLFVGSAELIVRNWKHFTDLFHFLT